MSRVAVITDSIADLTPQIVDELGIKIVPIQVRFGQKVYRDQVDISPDEFYKKLQHDRVFPATSVPTPSDFTSVLETVDADEVLIITLSSKLSGTYDTAKAVAASLGNARRIQVLDSGWAVMAEGFIVIAAAKAALDGASLDEVSAVAKRTMMRVDMRAAFNSLEYLRRGGRIGAASSLLGSLLHINPLIKLENGLEKPAGRAHSRNGAIKLLRQFVTSFATIEEIAIEDALADKDASKLADLLRSEYPNVVIHRSRMSPAMGTHTGPSTLVIAVLGDR